MKFEEQSEKKWERKQTSKETAVPYDRKLLGHTETVCIVMSVNTTTTVKRTNLTFCPKLPIRRYSAQSERATTVVLGWLCSGETDGCYRHSSFMVVVKNRCFVGCSRSGVALWGGRVVRCCRDPRAGCDPWWVPSHGHQKPLMLLGSSEPRRQTPHGAGPSPGRRQCEDGARMGHGRTKTGSSTLGGGGVHRGAWEARWGQ